MRPGATAKPAPAPHLRGKRDLAVVNAPLVFAVLLPLQHKVPLQDVVGRGVCGDAWHRLLRAGRRCCEASKLRLSTQRAGQPGSLCTRLARLAVAQASELISASPAHSLACGCPHTAQRLKNCQGRNAHLEDCLVFFLQSCQGSFAGHPRCLLPPRVALCANKDNRGNGSARNPLLPSMA